MVREPILALLLLAEGCISTSTNPNHTKAIGNKPSAEELKDTIDSIFYKLHGDGDESWFTASHRDQLFELIFDLYEEAETARSEAQLTAIFNGTVPATAEQRLEAYDKRTGEFDYDFKGGPELLEIDLRSEKLRALPYPEFLKTEYWRLVRDVIIKRDKGRCAICAHLGGIHVHHRSYKHHGQEHLFLEDLISLCRSCHQKFHNKLPER